MMDHLQWLIAFCGTSGPAGGLGLFASLALAGAVGSVVHCLPMCGGFVLAQVSGNLSRVKLERLCERQRISHGILVPYHVGRLVSYALLGALAAGSGGALGRLPRMTWLPTCLLLVGAGLFLAQATSRLAPAWRLKRPSQLKFDAAWIGCITALTRRINRARPGAGLLLGLVLGFLPCGLLYAALSVAAATAQPAQGALAMLAFGLGTIPSLVAVGIAGQLGARAWTNGVATLGPAVLVLNAGLLTVLACQYLVRP